jgi:hypothetical protein
LQDFREGGTTRASGLLILHDLDVVPLAGSSRVTQSECCSASHDKGRRLGKAPAANHEIRAAM